MVYKTVACALLAVMVMGTGVAQDGEPAAKFDKAELARLLKTAQSATDGMTKPTVEEAQQKLDAAKDELTKWLDDVGVKRDDKRVQPAGIQIAKVQSRIDKTRGRPRPRAEFAPFVGKWSAVGEQSGMRHVIDLTIQDSGEVTCKAKWTAGVVVSYTMDISHQYKDVGLQDVGSGSCVTQRSKGASLTTQLSPQSFTVDTKERRLESPLSNFTLSEDGTTITAEFKVQVTDDRGRKDDYKWDYELKRN